MPAVPIDFGEGAARRLALLRIGYAAILGHDVADLWQHAALWYGELSWPISAPAGVRLALGAWWVSLVFLLLGLCTRAAALANWCFCVVFLGFHSMRRGFEYHNDNVYILLAAGLVVLPSAAVLSLDSQRNRKRGCAVGASGETFVAWVAATLYLDSALWKLSSRMWLGGLGYWTPASQPTDALLSLDWTLEHEWIARGFGYTTLVYELLFVVLVWWRRARWPLLLVGAALHVGIATFLPLPRFGLLMLVLLAVLTPHPKAVRAARRRPQRVALAMFYGWWACVFVLGLRGPLHAWRHGEGTPLPAPSAPALQLVERWSYRLLGMRSHPIFLDSQFTGYTHETRVCYVPDAGSEPREFLPPRFNRHWVSWCYRFTWPAIPPERGAAWLERYVAHHGSRAGLDLERGHFVVERRPMVLPVDGWRAGARARNLVSPWRAVADVVMHDGRPVLRWRGAP
jgi:hypothetical protein